MVDINALMWTFFVNVGDVVQANSDPTGPDVAIVATTRPVTSENTRTTYLIDGENYFAAVKAEITSLLAGGVDRFFYTAGWEIGLSDAPDNAAIGEGSVTSAWNMDAVAGVAAFPALELQVGPAPFTKMIDDIKAMAAAGVDVRVLPWASPLLVNYREAALKADQAWSVNIHSLRSTLDLRALPGMEKKVVLNTLAHTLSAMHVKMVVCGDSTGFRGYAGGIDFVQNRNGPAIHDAAHSWHDLAIKVEGTGADGLYRMFQQLWNEQVQRSPKTFKAFGSEIPSQVDDTPLIDGRTTAPVGAGTQHTQLLRTLPTMNFAFFGTDRVPVNCIKRLITGFKQSKLSFAEDGVFEFRAAQRKAINAAQDYIYIEDQAFWNFELADWINARLKAVPGLKAILINMGDPNDGANPLVNGLMTHMSAGLASPGDRIAFALAPYTIHSKVTIIDDKWASIGSSNCIRRSFYMEGELSVAVLDEVEPSFAALLRRDLWAGHCSKASGAPANPLLALPAAFGIWKPAWGVPPAGFDLRPDIARMKVPFVYANPPGVGEFPGPAPGSMSEAERTLIDGDSRLEY
jgi:phosphatidylserine/phosphatidylglycerophosphate/cardiolipin synthase-like enzyme